MRLKNYLDFYKSKLFDLTIKFYSLTKKLFHMKNFPFFVIFIHNYLFILIIRCYFIRIIE